MRVWKNQSKNNVRRDATCCNYNNIRFYGFLLYGESGNVNCFFLFIFYFEFTIFPEQAEGSWKLSVQTLCTPFRFCYSLVSDEPLVRSVLSGVLKVLNVETVTHFPPKFELYLDIVYVTEDNAAFPHQSIFCSCMTYFFSPGRNSNRIEMHH